MLHHDNANSHTAKQTNKLKKKNVEFISNPAYSTDLAPCGYFLFAKIKSQLHGQRFSSPEEAVEKYRKHISKVRKEWPKYFQNCVPTSRVPGLAFRAYECPVTRSVHRAATVKLRAFVPSVHSGLLRRLHEVFARFLRLGCVPAGSRFKYPIAF
ncbi:Mariner Mos1 transposase [Eumeta japonica]|uniref:Mariner Mos1 transposase n=1 Tax=Eumeta variegata TaxID=151549 RepID=A0A4C1SEU2_EUMVA|nr:Mariner Mos1 transposase [Eumeta japonica]